MSPITRLVSIVICAVNGSDMRSRLYPPPSRRRKTAWLGFGYLGCMHPKYRCACVLLAIALTARPAPAQPWSGPVRGSWVRDGEPQAGDVDLTNCQIAVGEKEASPVRQAAIFLSGDLEKLGGRETADSCHSRRPAASPFSCSRWGTGWFLKASARTISTGDGRPTTSSRQPTPSPSILCGSNARGTAFAAYVLAERLGIDPLHHWTGYEPQRRERLMLKKTDEFSSGPSFQVPRDVPRRRGHTAPPLRVQRLSAAHWRRAHRVVRESSSRPPCVCA
jgi:hypothetical protein